MMTSIEIVAYKPNMEVVFFGSALSLLFRQSQPANQADAVFAFGFCSVIKFVVPFIVCCSPEGMATPKVVLIKKFFNNYPPSLKASADRSAWVFHCCILVMGSSLTATSLYRIKYYI
jgi:hypothetical protein